MNEHDFEPVPGLPANLPAGETLLWQGAPRWASLARTAFHARKLVIYFAVLLIWYVVVAVHDGAAIGQALVSASWFAGLAAIALMLVMILAWATARTTLYTITSRRVVIRCGIALPLTVNIPFRRIASAGVKTHADGTGDLLLTLSPGDHIAWAALWPHVRPWHVAKVQPLLRSVPDAQRAAQILARALAAATAQPVQPVAETAAAGSARDDSAVPA